jgi:ABC-2 type transport system ATP-binding protein
MLRVERVHKEFGSVIAVRDVSCSIPGGSTLGLIGPNGAGKTTTMRMVVGILTPDGGSVEWKGTPIDGSMRRLFGYLPEERGLYGKMRVREQIRYFGRLHGLDEPGVSKRTDAWIERLELQPYANRPCAELSKGNQQKVQIACAAVHEPELLILDEPFSGLDPVNAEMLLHVIRDLKAAGTTLVLSSHQMWQLEELCDSFCIVAEGRSVASGTLAELRSSWTNRIVRVVPPSAAVRAVLDAIPGARLLDGTNGSLNYEMRTDTDFAAVLRTLVDRESITAFETIEPSLHEIYLRTIGTEAHA